MMKTNEELLKIIELSEKATPGVLHWVTEPGKHAIIAAIQDNSPVIDFAIVHENINDKNGKQKKANAAFIVSACNAAADMAQELLELRSKAEQTCEWVYDLEVWDTSCGNSFFFDSGSVKENSFKFCPYCGKKITAKPYSEADNE